MRHGNGAAVGTEQELARCPGTVLSAFPAPKLCLTAPEQTQLCALGLPALDLGAKWGRGASPAHPPPWCWGVTGGRCINPLLHKAGLDCSSSPCWGHIEDPCAGTLPTADGGGRAPRYGDSAARGGGRVCASWADPLAPNGSGRQGAPVLRTCCAEVELRLWLLLSEGPGHPWHPLKH